jgi:hypothetical protein
MVDKERDPMKGSKICHGCGQVVGLGKTIGGFEGDQYYSFCDPNCRTESLKRYERERVI